MGMVSTEIPAAIHQIIVNGAALIASTQAVDEGRDGSGGEDWEIIELDAVELLAEYIHFCEICGKGFKRDFKTPEALAKPGKCGGVMFGSSIFITGRKVSVGLSKICHKVFPERLSIRTKFSESKSLAVLAVLCGLKAPVASSCVEKYVAPVPFKT
nr:protein SENSITIVE TO PROTON RHIZOTOXICITY 1-like [Ipomoea batatas]